MLEIGDIVQITDETHPWYPCLIVVTEPKSWGLQGYVTIPTNAAESEVGNAFIRLKTEQVERVGHVAIIRAVDEKE